MARAAPLPPSKMSPLEQRIRVLCEREGLDESTLGITAGLSTDTVGQWVRKSRDGALPGRLEQWLKLAKHYQVPVDWLIDPAPLPPGYELGRDVMTADIRQEAELLSGAGRITWLRVAAWLSDRYPFQAREIVVATSLAAESFGAEPKTGVEAFTLVRLELSKLLPARLGPGPDASKPSTTGDSNPGAARHSRGRGKAFAKDQKKRFKSGESDGPRSAETGDD